MLWAILSVFMQKNMEVIPYTNVCILNHYDLHVRHRTLHHIQSIDKFPRRDCYVA